MDVKELEKRRGQSLGYLMGKAQRSMDNHMQKLFAEAGLAITKEQWILLANLWIRDGQNQQELATNVFKDKASITRSLSNMEAQSLLVRIEDKEDRRNKLIHLTKKGKDLFLASFPLVSSLHEEALNGLTEEEIGTCRKVLNTIYKNLSSIVEKTVEDAT